MAPSGQPASWTGRFVRVYKRPRSGFQFSPIISNSRVSWQDLSGHYSFYHFAFFSSFSSFSPRVLLSALLPCAVFSVCRLPELFQSSRRGRTYQARRLRRDHRLRLAGITERERGVPEEKGVLAKGDAGDATGGFHFRDLWGSLRERQACDFRADLGFAVISSYLTLTLQCFSVSLSSFFFLSLMREIRGHEQALPFIDCPASV